MSSIIFLNSAKESNCTQDIRIFSYNLHSIHIACCINIHLYPEFLPFIIILDRSISNSL